MTINQSMKKYGIKNCKIEVIDFAQNYWQADCLEQNYIKQYDSHIKNGKGYNVSLGGPVAPKSDEWKQQLSNWHASLSPEEKKKRSERQRQSMLNTIATQGHPAQGTKRTNEQKANISTALKALDKTLIYTPEVRKNMSDAHVGKKQPEELVRKRAETIRNNKGEMICGVPDCGIIEDRRHAPVIDGIRYCGAHAARLISTGTLYLLPRKAYNKKQFTEEQINNILSDKRAAKIVGSDYGVSERVILRVRKEFNK